MRVRVATWNVWWRFGPWEARQPLIEAELRRIDADIVCLQEAYVTEQGEDQPAALREALGLADHRYVAGAAHEGVGFGNAVLSRWPISRHEVAPLPPDDQGGADEHRLALLTMIKTPDGPLPVATTHLNFLWDHSGVRQRQVAALCHALGTWMPLPRPVVVTGDLNAGPDSDELRLLTGRSAPPVRNLGFFDAWDIAGDGPGPTWTRENGHVREHTVEPDRRIDYVLVGHPMGNNAVRVDHAERFGRQATDGIHPSDHLGVLADLRW